MELVEPFEASCAALVPYDDPRIAQIKDQCTGSAKLLDGFIDGRGDKVQPSAIIYRSDAPTSVKTPEALTSLRNILAISAILLTWAGVSLNGSPSVLFSDSFDFYAVVVAQSGGLIIHSPALRGYRSRDVRFLGTPSPGLARPYKVGLSVDKVLSERLVHLWQQRYAKGSKRRYTITLFRSLEVAYDAASMPIRNQSSLYDHGMRIALWVSALEILARVAGKRVLKEHVMNLVNTSGWMDRRLRHRRYVVKIARKKCRCNLASRVLDAMYTARNDFLHGNPVTARSLRLVGLQGKPPPLYRLAPLMYRAALLGYLYPKGIRLDFGAQWTQGVYERRLLQLAGREA